MAQAGPAKKAQPSPAKDVITPRRAQLRAQAFGDDAGAETWSKSEKGFCTIPRTLPLLCTLIRTISRSAAAPRVYLDLWSREREDGFVDIEDEEECAAACGYQGGFRGVRYWRKGMDELVRLGFIKVAKKNSRKHGYALLLHPQDAVHRLYHGAKPSAPDWWRPLFERVLINTGARRRAPQCE